MGIVLLDKSPLMHSIQVTIKYALDRFFSSLLLIILSPVFLIISLIIKADGGPVFFSQQRLGLHGICFKIYKFRSMIVNADDFLDDKGLPTRARITKVGAFLRKTSLDELPQLINVFLGNMSIVGPRPALPENLHEYTDEQKQRLLMKPGVTGLAQVNGRNSLKWSERIQYDVQYVKHFSLWLDIKIVLKTIWVVCTSKGMAEDRNPSDFMF